MILYFLKAVKTCVKSGALPTGGYLRLKCRPLLLHPPWTIPHRPCSPKDHVAKTQKALGGAKGQGPSTQTWTYAPRAGRGAKHENIDLRAQNISSTGFLKQKDLSTRCHTPRRASNAALPRVRLYSPDQDTTATLSGRQSPWCWRSPASWGSGRAPW